MVSVSQTHLLTAVKSAASPHQRSSFRQENTRMVSRETMRVQFPRKHETGVCAGVEAGDFRGFQDLP